MDVTWILILLIPISGFIKGVDVDSIYGFQTKEACEEVATVLRIAYEEKRDSRLTTICAPTSLEALNN